MSARIKTTGSKKRQRTLRSLAHDRERVSDIGARPPDEAEILIFRGAIESSPDPFFIVDPVTLRFLYVNDTACRRVGITREQYLRLSVMDVTRLKRAELERTYAEAIAKSGESITTQFIGLAKDGRRTWIEGHIRALRLGDRWVIVTNSRDITERKLAEKAAARRARLQALLGAANEAMLRSQSPQELYQRLCDAVVHKGEFIAVAWLLPDADARALTVAASGGVHTWCDINIPLAAAPAGNNPIGAAYRTHQPCLGNDALGAENVPALPGFVPVTGIKAWAAFPLIRNERAIGVLFIGAGDRYAFDDESVSLLRGMIENIPFALDNLERTAERRRAEDAQQRVTRMYEALSATNEAIMRTTSPEELFQQVCDAAVHGARFSSTSVLLVQPNSSWLTLVAGTGANIDIMRELRISTDATHPEGRGLIGPAVRTRAPCIGNDLDADARMGPWTEARKKLGTRAGAALPIFQAGRAVGAIAFYSIERDAFDPEIVKLLERMAENISFALDNFARNTERNHSEQAQRRSAQMYAALSATNEAIMHARSPEQMFQQVCDAAVHGGKFTITAVVLLEPDTLWTRVVAVTGKSADWMRQARISIDPALPEGRGMSGIAHRTGKPCIVNDFLNDERTCAWHALARTANALAGAAIPLTRGGRFVGTLQMYAGETNAFDPEIVGLLQRMAQNVSFALDNFDREAERQRAEQALRTSEEKYRNILESIEDAYYEVDLKGNIVFINSAFCRLLGYSEHELIGMNNRRYQTAEVAAKVYGIFNQVYRSGEPTTAFDWEIIRQDGRLALVEASIHLIKGSDGEPIGFRGILRDVTARRQMEQQLRESEERFRSLIELSTDWYWEFDTEFRFVRIEAQSGGQEVKARFASDVGHAPWDLGIEAEGGWDKQRQILEAHQPFQDLITTRVLEDGTRRYASIVGEPLFDRDGRFIGYRGVGRDITERKRAEERIQYLATHDALTGLPNRTMFAELLHLALESARRYTRQCAVLFIDLDRFKLINDTLGHEAGDVLLREMALRLKECLRGSDVVARLGGDEFVVLLPEVGEAQLISTVARKILSGVLKPVVILGQECRVTASIGVAMFPHDASDEQALMKNADIAMYLAKEEGKNNFQFYSKDIKTQSLERLALETHLGQALERNEFALHYQAKLDLKSGRITGVEALLRWHNPVLGSVSPAQFIPLAEETGLIVPIGQWVLRTACAQNMAWQRAGLASICMAVNLSARQFTDPHLLDDIGAVLADTGMASQLLELEITEGMVAHNPERALELLTTIKQMGVRLAIDDFGTGYSSLGQLKTFPIDTLKVDRSFIRDIPQDAEDMAITQAIIAMGKTLSLTVVAEGVETQPQMQFLREHGCDEMQGYYFSKPIAPEKFAELLRTHVPAAQS